MKIVKSSCSGKKRVRTCTFSPQVNIKNKRQSIQTQEDVNAAYSEAKIQDLVEDLKNVIWTKVSNVATSDSFGFDEDEVNDYFFVDVTPTEIGEDHHEAVRVEVRAEVSYDGLEELMDALNPIIESYDSYAYFEPVEPGIIEAYVSVNQVDMSVYGSTSNDYPDYLLYQYHNKKFHVHSNESTVKLDTADDVYYLWKASVSQSAGAYNAADEDYVYAFIRGQGTVEYYKHNGNYVATSTYDLMDDDDFEQSWEYMQVILNDVCDRLIAYNKDVPDRMVYNSTSIEASEDLTDLPEDFQHAYTLAKNDFMNDYKNAHVNVQIDPDDPYAEEGEISVYVSGFNPYGKKCARHIYINDSLDSDTIYQALENTAEDVGIRKGHYDIDSSTSVHSSGDLSMYSKQFHDAYTSAYIDFKERYPQIEVSEIYDDPSSDDNEICIEICDTNSGDCGKLYLDTQDEFVDSDYILRSFEETAESIGMRPDESNADYSSLNNIKSSSAVNAGAYMQDDSIVIDAEDLKGYSKDEIKKILDDAPVGSEIIHIRSLSNRFNLDSYIEKKESYKSNYNQGFSSPNDWKTFNTYWTVGGTEDPYIVRMIYEAVNGKNKYYGLTSDVLKAHGFAAVESDTGDQSSSTVLCSYDEFMTLYDNLSDEEQWKVDDIADTNGIPFYEEASDDELAWLHDVATIKIHASADTVEASYDGKVFIEDIIDGLEDNGYDLSRIRSIRRGLLELFGYKGKDADIIIHDLVASGFIDPNDWVDKDYTPGIYSATEEGHKASENYKGRRIRLLNDGTGYAIFEKGEMIDYGFKSLEDAEEAIDEYDDIYQDDVQVYSATNDGEGYWFFTTHGVQPGSVPRDVDILDIIDTPNGSFVKFDRFLSTKELNEYDMVEKAPKSVMSSKESDIRLGDTVEYNGDLYVIIDDESDLLTLRPLDRFVPEDFDDPDGGDCSEDVFLDRWQLDKSNRRYVKLSEEAEDSLPMVDQEYDSAATSINSNKLPAIYKMVNFNEGDVVVDFGGGKFDNAVEYIRDKGATLCVYDPYNRSAEHNKEVLRILRENGGADAAVNSNVLNVIKEPEARKNVLENIARITKPGAPIYITVYEGKGDGQEGPTKSGYQLNRKTADYLEEIQEVFPDATRRGKLITAHNSGVSAATNITNIGAKITCSDEYDTTWIKLAQKQVPDSDGFYTDYTMYISDDGTSYIFMFGDEDIYGPDPEYADYECSDWNEASEWWNDYNGFVDDNSLNDIQSSSSTDVTASTVLDMNPEFRNNFEEAVDFFYEDYPATVELTDEVDEDYDTLYKAYVEETGSLYQQTPGIVYIDINWDSGEILQALQETAEAIGIEQYPDNIESSESVEGDAFSQLEDAYLSPSEYDEPIEHEDSEELVEIELDQIITVDVDGDYEWDDDTYVWASPDRSNEEWRSEDGVYIDDKVGVVEHIDDLIIPNVPVRPGKYRVTGLAELVYDVSGIQEYRTEYGPDDYDSDIDIDHAVVSFNFRKSEVKNLKITPVRR